jgi:hypothetical protein
MTNPIQPPKDSIQPELNRLQASRERTLAAIAELSVIIENIERRKRIRKAIEYRKNRLQK